MLSLQRLEGVQHVRSLIDAVTVGPLGQIQPLIPSVDRESADAYRAARQTAVTHPLVLGQLLSADAATSLIIVRLAGDSLGISQIQPHLTAIRQVVSDPRIADHLWFDRLGFRL